MKNRKFRTPRSRVTLGALAILSTAGLIYCAPADDGGQTGGDQNVTATGPANLLRTGNRLRSVGADPFYDKVQPILAEKCVTCHACAEAPCQIKLNSTDGLNRGGANVDPYALHVGSITPTGNEDQFSGVDWKKHGFFGITGANASQSILGKALAAGKTNKPGFNSSWTQTGIPKWTCPGTPQAYDQYISRNPTLGMPYGLPKLADDEYKTLEDWIAAGSPGPATDIQAKSALPTVQAVVDKWEAFFFTGDPVIGYGSHVDLVGRYIYEHSFLAHIHFDENPGEFFELVRSRTPPGHPIDQIFTELPYDPPGIASRVYYRLKKINKVIARKNHIVWNLNDAKLAFYNDLFYKKNKWWNGSTKAATYTDWNPFQNFDPIPAKIRYQFLLDNSSLLIDGMTRGPVCVGSMATYVVADHFWGWFLDPDSDPSVLDPKLGMKDYSALGVKDGAHTLTYLKAWEASLRKSLKARGKKGLSVDDLWNGKKGSPYPSKSAWTTIIRNETNMTVHTGSAGGMPQSIWVESFSHLERLYYDLVASFKPYGSAAHKIQTWQYMSYIRTEGEDLFISLLPEDQRQKVRDEYTSGWIGTVKRLNDFGIINQLWKDALVKAGYLNTNMLAEGRPSGETGVVTPTILASKFTQHLGKDVVNQDGDPLNNFPQQSPGFTVANDLPDQKAFENAFRTLTQTQHWGNSKFFPNVAYMRVGGEGGVLYSIVADRGYDSHSQEFAENLVRRPEKDMITLYRGIVGNYPGLFLDISYEKASEAIKAMQLITDQGKWDAFVGQFGVSRSSANFWPFVTWVNHWQEKNDIIDGGIVDLSLYGVRTL